MKLLCALMFSMYLQFVPQLHSTNTSFLPSFQKIVVEKVEKNQPLRWKHIFRPVIILKKKASFWMKIAALIILPLLIFFAIVILDKGDGEANDFEKYSLEFLLGVLFLATFVLFLVLIALPFIYIYRMLEELNWKKRFVKCPKYKRF